MRYSRLGAGVLRTPSSRIAAIHDKNGRTGRPRREKMEIKRQDLQAEQQQVYWDQLLKVWHACGGRGVLPHPCPVRASLHTLACCAACLACIRFMSQAC
eukprot:352598-Chlamydomonas_euryale.AAC.9